jgi:hypothetical protein
VLESSVCNGNGQCVEKTTPRGCGAFACDDAKGECFRECNQNSQCRRGAICRPAADGRGVCHDEDTECDGRYSIRTQSGSSQSCLGYRCVERACAFKDCSPGVPGECAPGYVCRARACVEVTGEEGDAGGGRADGGARKPQTEADGGVPAEVEPSSCTFARPRGAGRVGGVSSLVALSLACLFSVRLRRGTRVKRRRVPGGVRTDP